jgi:hypothetical protein
MWKFLGKKKMSNRTDFDNSWMGLDRKKFSKKLGWLTALDWLCEPSPLSRKFWLTIRIEIARHSIIIIFC